VCLVVRTGTVTIGTDGRITGVAVARLISSRIAGVAIARLTIGAGLVALAVVVVTSVVSGIMTVS